MHPDGQQSEFSFSIADAEGGANICREKFNQLETALAMMQKDMENIKLGSKADLGEKMFAINAAISSTNASIDQLKTRQHQMEMEKQQQNAAPTSTTTMQIDRQLGEKFSKIDNFMEKMGKQMEQLGGKVDKLQAENEELKEENGKMKAELDGMKGAVEELKLEIADKDQKMEKMKAEIDGMKEKNGKIRAEIEMKAEIDGMKGAVEEMKEGCAQFRGQIADLNKEVAKLAEDNGKSKEEVGMAKDLKIEMAKLNGEMTKMKGECVGKTGSIESRLVKLINECAKQKGEIKENVKLKEYNDLKIEMAKLKGEMTRMKAEMKENERTKTEMEKAMAKMKEEIAKSKAEIAGKNAAMEKQIAYLKEMAAKLDAKNRELAEKKSDKENYASLSERIVDGISAAIESMQLDVAKFDSIAAKNNKLDADDGGSGLDVLWDGLSVYTNARFIGANSVRAILPIPQFNQNAKKPYTAFYFEVQILEKSSILYDNIRIGFCDNQFPKEGTGLGKQNNSIAIWHRGGVDIDGLHTVFQGQINYIFHGDSVIGVGLTYSPSNSSLKLKCFATWNGTLLGSIELPKKFVGLKLYPAVTLLQAGDSIQANFGKTAWLFNPNQMVQ